MASRASDSTQVIRDQVARVLATPDFSNFPRSFAFLSYVVEETLAGRSGDLKEAVIGVQVFGRQPGYDSKSDSVVRAQARRVRERLSEYYASAGKTDPVRIEIPKGGYVPAFHLAADPDLVGRPGVFRNRALAAALAGFAVLAATASVVVSDRRHLPSGDGPVRTLAVLPFADLDSARRFDSLAAGITEDLERSLSRVRQLRIHARPPSTTPSGDRADYPRLGRTLAVESLLDGRVVTVAGQTEIQVTLIRASDGSLLWTDHYPANAAVGDTERQIEIGVANALGVKPPQPSPIAEDPRVHDLFFAGRTLWATRNREKTLQAIQLFQQAIQIDPHDALPYMGIADAYGLMAAHGQIDTERAIELGEPAARRALELDPSLAEAHAALGMLLGLQWNLTECDAEYQRAIELNPSYDRAYVRAGVLRFLFGDFPAAERLMRRAETLNPYAMSLPLIRAELYYYWHRYDDSENLVRNVLKADPKNSTAFQLLARDFLQQRQPERALEAQRTAIADDPQTPLYQIQLVVYLQATGKTAEASAQLARVGPVDALDPLLLAYLYAHRGDRAKTLGYLEKALAIRAGDLPSARWDPALDFIRQEPRYLAIIARIYGHN
jgi:TolB-like protein/tetratricopeptide (TPR) repeat protein